MVKIILGRQQQPNNILRISIDRVVPCKGPEFRLSYPAKVQGVSYGNDEASPDLASP